MEKSKSSKLRKLGNEILKTKETHQFVNTSNFPKNKAIIKLVTCEVHVSACSICIPSVGLILEHFMKYPRVGLILKVCGVTIVYHNFMFQRFNCFAIIYECRVHRWWESGSQGLGTGSLMYGNRESKWNIIGSENKIKRRVKKELWDIGLGTGIQGHGKWGSWEWQPGTKESLCIPLLLN